MTSAPVRWTPAAVGVVAALLSGAALWRPSAWFDEAATAVAVRMPTGDLFRLIEDVDLVHALYYLWLRPWTALAGTDPWALRLPSALAVGVAAAGVVVLGRRLGSPRLGLVAGLVFALLPRVTWMGTEARSSALVSALVVWWTVALLWAVRRGGRSRWAVYGVLGTASVLTFTFATFVVVGHALTLAVCRRRPPAAAFVAGGWVLLVGAAMAYGVSHQSGQVDWLPTLSVGTVYQVGVEQFTKGASTLAVLAWLLAGTAVILERSPRRWRSGLSAVPLALPWLVLPTVALLVITLVAVPVYWPRYLAFTAAPFALLIAVPLDRLSRWPAAALLTLVAVLAAPAYVAQRQVLSKENPDWALVADHLERSANPGDVVVWGPFDIFPSDTRTISEIYPEAFSELQDVTRGETRQGLWFPSAPLEAADLEGTSTVWVVRSAERPLLDSQDQALALAAAGFESSGTWTGPATVVTRFTGPAAQG